MVCIDPQFERRQEIRDSLRTLLDIMKMMKTFGLMSAYRQHARNFRRLWSLRNPE